ncbi:CynX/NimT family MFS transporter [Actinomadura macrotermitis]|uniref:Putative transporter YycB n=1 Tax=Actinomadura macrotermitis TaxID=2585200 RepID=A0A7K0BW35_9ACTN|nr:MFS transporter [Actinomadura macrotermitis]MQY05385.1 putative transporter YycB [Actinomadura macrotermitis]
MTASPRVSRVTSIWTLAGLILLTVNLRAAITGISPLLSDLQRQFGLSGVAVSVLTTLPVLCLGAFASLAPVAARRLGTEPAIAAALLLITVGVVLRVAPSQAALFAGTVLAGAGIAMGNVLMPSVIKRAFPGRIGSLTGLAMMLMACSGAIAAGLAVPLSDAAGWRLALAVWAVPSLVAALVWGPLALRGRRAAAPAEAAPAVQGTLLRSPLAWYVAAFMGLASLMFYVLMSWLPEIMRDHGVAPATAGMMVSAMMIIGIPLGFVVPVAAARMRDQRLMVYGVGLAMAVGIGGLMLAPQAGWVWAVFLGIATGSAFPLAYTLLGLRSASPAVAARLSGMAQTGGYLLAGLGPLAVGVLHSVTGGWQVSLGLLLALTVPEVVFGVLASRPGIVRPSSTAPEGRAEALVEPKDVAVLEPARAR